jgi:hypothetical protein
MRLLLIYLIFNTICISYTLSIKDKLPNITLKDQFNKYINIPKDTKILITTSNDFLCNQVVKFFRNQHKNFLTKNKLIYINRLEYEINFISHFLHIYKMKQNKFSILNLDSTYKELFELRNNHITIYKLRKRMIINISYIKKYEELEMFFKKLKTKNRSKI